MDLKAVQIPSLKSLELFEVVSKLQNIINNGSIVPQFIQFAKNMEDVRKKWLQCEERNKEYESLIERLNQEKSTLQRQVNELKVDIEIHYEKRIKAENEREKLQQQIEMFRKILDDRQSYPLFNEEEKNILFQTPNNANISKRLSHTRIDETGSLISDYTEEDLDENEFDTRTPHKRRTRYRTATNIHSPQYNTDEIRRLSLRRNKRQKGSLTRQEMSEKKRSRTRSHETPIIREQQNQGITTAAITAITTLKIGEDGKPITVTSEIQHNNSTNDSPSKQKFITNTATSTSNNKNKLEVAFMRPKVTKHKRPSREFLQRSIDESESTDSEIFWNSETATHKLDDNHQQRNAINLRNTHLLTPIVETPHYMKLSKENIDKFNTETIKQTPYKNLSATPLLQKRNRKPHSFKTHVILNSENCAHCDKRTKFGKVVLKCRDCDLIVHQECKDILDRPCYLPVNFPSHGTINEYVTNEIPKIPTFLQYIIAEIELRGLNKEVGLYRINGSDIAVKQLKEKLIKRHQLPDLRKIIDVHVLCSFVKDFLNNLSEHLITFDTWGKFAKACEIEDENERFMALQSLIRDLPAANRDTLAFIILHLQRVSQSPECKMSPMNLSYVFGPSIVGNSSANLSPSQVINEVRIQHAVVENLISMPFEFYEKIINVTETKLFKNAPNTPEILRKSRTATVLQSLLGPAVNNAPSNPPPPPPPLMQQQISSLKSKKY